MSTKLDYPDSVPPELAEKANAEFNEQLEAYGQKLEEAWLSNDSLWQDPTGEDPLNWKAPDA